MQIKTCSIVGLGKLGACMAVAIASRGFRVIGVDKDLSRINAFKVKRSPILEPGVDKLLKKYGQRILATTNYEKAILDSEVTFIVVPTPSKINGEFSLSYVKESAIAIGRALSKKQSYHLLVLTSTVLPGSTARVRSILEKKSSKVCGKDFGLCYNPEFIALGTAIYNFLNPDFILIGESDKNSGRILEGFYKKICENNPPVARMNFINAELTKLAVNSFVTTKITFANMLAGLAQRLPGGDVDIVTEALGFDSRIGNRYLKGGLGYGGPCFPRDNAALYFIAKKLKIQADIPKATDSFNHRIIKHLFKLVCSKIKPKGVVGILGLSYKPKTPVIEKSQGFLLAQKLIKANIKVILYDPLAINILKKVVGRKVMYAVSIKEAIQSSDVLAITNPDPKFAKLKIKDFLLSKRPLVVIDCWRLLRSLQLYNLSRIEYIPFGIGGPKTN